LYPEKLALSDLALYRFVILQPSVFKTKSTMEPMTESSFQGGKSMIEGEVPAQVSDKKKAENFTLSVKSAAFSLAIFTSGSVFFLFIK
jgi:hypothetical protein